MMPPMRRILYCMLLLGFLFPSQSVQLVAQTSTAANTVIVSYEKDVRPIFKTHCFQCHGENNVMEGGLDLRLNRFIQKGGENGPATIAGNHKESLIWQRVSSGAMPPEDNNLSPQEIRIIEQWIQQGAKNLNTEPESLDNSKRAAILKLLDEESAPDDSTAGVLVRSLVASSPCPGASPSRPPSSASSASIGSLDGNAGVACHRRARSDGE